MMFLIRYLGIRAMLDFSWPVFVSLATPCACDGGCYFSLYFVMEVMAGWKVVAFYADDIDISRDLASGIKSMSTPWRVVGAVECLFCLIYGAPFWAFLRSKKPSFNRIA